MRIKKLYTYPIKGLQPTTLTEAVVTPQGFPFDRRFMLLKVVKEQAQADGQNDGLDVELKNMHVSNFPELSLFLTDIVFPSETDSGRIIVTYNPSQHSQKALGPKYLEIPLQPDVEGLRQLEINMHRSSTAAYEMGNCYSDWFSECLGYRVVLVHLGNRHSRRVLGTFSPNLSSAHRDFLGQQSTAVGGLTGLLSSVLRKAPRYLGYSDAVGEYIGTESITFADCAPYLVVSQTSLENVSSRLGSGEEMDVTKFRPNIVISGAENAFEEDYWAELVISRRKSGDAEVCGSVGPVGDGVRLLLTANCVRCKSINIDYLTGAPGKGESGSVLKKLMKDRRVDKGAKYSPVFGRYAFLGKGSDQKCDGACLRAGDDVVVSRLITERTTYDWPGLTN